MCLAMEANRYIIVEKGPEEEVLNAARKSKGWRVRKYNVQLKCLPLLIIIYILWNTIFFGYNTSFFKWCLCVFGCFSIYSKNVKAYDFRKLETYSNQSPLAFTHPKATGIQRTKFCNLIHKIRYTCKSLNSSLTICFNAQSFIFHN